MINKEFFIDILKQIRSAMDFSGKAEKLGISIFDTNYGAALDYFQDKLLEAYFQDSAVDHIMWFVWEHHDFVDDFDSELNMLHRGRLGMWDIENIPIPMDTIDDLWNYVIDLRK